MKHPDARSVAGWLTCLAVAAWAPACAESGALRGYRWVGVGALPARANAGARQLCEAVAEVIATSDLPRPLVEPCGAGEVKRAIATRNLRVLTEEADSVWLVFDADGAHGTLSAAVLAREGASGSVDTRRDEALALEILALAEAKLDGSPAPSTPELDALRAELATDGERQRGLAGRRAGAVSMEVRPGLEAETCRALEQELRAIEIPTTPFLDCDGESGRRTAGADLTVTLPDGSSGPFARVELAWGAPYLPPSTVMSTVSVVDTVGETQAASYLDALQTIAGIVLFNGMRRAEGEDTRHRLNASTVEVLRRPTRTSAPGGEGVRVEITLATPRGSSGPIRSIAIPALRSESLSAEECRLLTDAAVFEASAVREIRVVSEADIEAMLGFEQRRDMLGCADVSCMAELGGALGVDAIVRIEVGRIGETLRISCALVEIGRAETLVRGSATVEAGEDALPAAIEKLVRELLMAGLR